MLVVFTLLSLLPIYLIGAFPTGYLLAKSQGVNIHEHGSGNPGATNVSRVLGKKAGIITLIGDVAKGVLAIICARAVSDQSWYHSIAAVTAVCGHCISIPPLLKGGKGVATSLGVISALAPILGVAGVVIFGVSFWLSRFVSVSSIAAALGIPIVAILIGVTDDQVYALAVIGLVVVARHHENISRLIKGTEPKFKAKS